MQGTGNQQYAIGAMCQGECRIITRSAKNHRHFFPRFASFAFAGYGCACFFNVADQRGAGLGTFLFLAFGALDFDEELDCFIVVPGRPAITLEILRQRVTGHGSRPQGMKGARFQIRHLGGDFQTHLAHPVGDDQDFLVALGAGRGIQFEAQNIEADLGRQVFILGGGNYRGQGKGGDQRQAGDQLAAHHWVFGRPDAAA